MEGKTIRTTVEDRIGTITLSRPENRNAISIQMRREISACLDEWQCSEKVHAVVFTGSGAIFSAGFDLKEFGKPELFDELYSTSALYHREIWHFPKPVIAAVNGAAVAGGLDLATMCDIRICDPSAVFGHPEIKFGVPPLFTPLRWIVGDGIARDLCLTGRRINAEEALRIGLVSEVVRDESLIERAIRLAKEILEAPFPALQFVKGYLKDNANRGFEESFCVEHDKAFQEFLLKKAVEGLKKGSP
ncbi:MAG TPA: enoyl-CoA hydratase/isomerase family protein [Syntrophales bacterium]|nr:enoyl-CoA hydratase/isomerase family protein [Syntrophales bacterium]HRT71141.1 enoyl-CoA hydratase/isomerase family protein [Syntrophales bacterium]